MAGKAPQTPEEEIAALKEQLAKEKAEKAEALKLNEEVQQQLAERDAAAKRGSTLPVFTHNRAMYQVLAHQFQHDGEIVTAAELANNKKLQATLVESGSGLIHKVEA